MKKLRIALVALIFAAACATRFAAIHYGLPSKNRALTTYHPDEPLSLYTIEHWQPARLRFHPGRAILWGGFHLFPMAAALKLAQLSGYVHFGSRDFYVQHLEEADRLYIVARAVQVLCGALSVLVLFAVGSELAGWVAGALAAFFLCFSAVHLANSFLTRPDAMMILFALLSLLFTLRAWRRPLLKDSVWSGIFLGLAAATKYSAAPYGIFPVLIHFFSPHPENRKNLLFCLASGATAFLAGCPYLVLDFPWFRQQFFLNAGLVTHAITPVVPGPGCWTYLVYFIPHGLGWPLAAAGALGWLWILAKSLRGKPGPKETVLQNRLAGLLALGGAIVYAVISLPKSQQVWYTLPVVPLFALFAALLCADALGRAQPAARWTGMALSLFLCAYSAVYSLAYLSLFTAKNVREEASDWIEKNIPAGSSVGIVRSYFWTPGLLRQYHPPYRLLEGGGDQSFLEDAVLGMDQVARQARYLVLTEFEYRVYLDPRFSGSFPRQAALLNDLMNRRYREVARFDREAEFLSIRFPKKGFEPFDWILPNPTIRVFEKVHAGA